MLSLSAGKGEAVFDVRSPVTLPLEQTLERARTALEKAGFLVEVTTFDKPHYVPKESALVKLYLRFTANKPGIPVMPLQ